MKSIFSVLAIIVSTFVFSQKINWLSLDEATKESKINPSKPILLNLYTDWCGFCKKLDKETFVNPAVIEYVNQNYIPIKFNAEQKDMVTFLGVNYSFIGQARANFLAYVLTQGRLSYPATIVLNNSGEAQKIIYGYRSPADFNQDIKI
jgi:uncharacterized protein YyaL (SSP411 family)